MPLPGKRPDKYQDVDQTNMSTAHEMTRAEMLEMAQLSETRGDMDSKAQWNQLAGDHARAEETREAGIAMRDLMAPKPQPPLGQILEGTPDTPWASDTEFQKLDNRYRQAQANLDAADHRDPKTPELRTLVSNLKVERDDRERLVRDEAAQSGQWTAQNEAVVAAQSSLAKKAAQVVDMFND